MRITKYHQSAFTIQTRNGNVYAVDFGSEVPAEMVASIGKPAATIISHKHPDHFHVEHIRQFGAQVYGPRDVISELRSLDIAQRTIMPGDTAQLADLQIRAYESDHGPNLSAPIDNLALAFMADGKKVLYLGDMAVASSIPSETWDLILVPVGGSKVFTPEGAAEFLRSLKHTGIAVPVHYHGRADRTSGQQFSEIAGAYRPRELNVGESLEV